MKFATLLLLLSIQSPQVGITRPLMALNHDDAQWEFFHPESVTQISCKVEQVNVSGRGEASRDAFMAEAKAKRKNGEGDWGMTIGQFPVSLKGRHEAERVCSKWMDQAMKRMKAAQ